MNKKIVKIILFLILILLVSVFTFNNKTKNHDKKIKKSNIYEKFSFYNDNYKDRYDSYRKKNPNLSIKNIVTQVNIGLDYSFYTHTKKTPYLNKDYILVNKYLFLGNDYVPESLEYISTSYSRKGMQLVSNAKNQFEKMAQEALKDNIKIIAMSSYRGYDYQFNLYNNYVKQDGVAAADTYSARPGYSEHQTGLCVDVYDGIVDYTNFEQTDAFKWMQNNAYKYGFILRYPNGKENITGYQYESWHYRYVGKNIATYIHNNGITFDEYYVQKIENKY